jgi:predicted phage tail protein|eukprot:1735555-Prymnesium_polylepis.1
MDAINTAQEHGKTFTEFVHEFNGGAGQDTTTNGTELSGSRMDRDSKWVKYWEEAKAKGSSDNAASALMDNVIDKDHNIDEHVRTGIEGTAAGVASEMGAAALAGTALTGAGLGVACVAGGASYLAAVGSSQLVDTVLAPRVLAV